MSIDHANKASESLIDSIEWLNEELKASSPNSPLLPLVDHILAEGYRVAVLCALAKNEGTLD